jgi:hypothetical protein
MISEFKTELSRLRINVNREIISNINLYRLNLKKDFWKWLIEIINENKLSVGSSQRLGQVSHQF